MRIRGGQAEVHTFLTLMNDFVTFTKTPSMTDTGDGWDITIYTARPLPGNAIRRAASDAQCKVEDIARMSSVLIADAEDLELDSDS